MTNDEKLSDDRTKGDKLNESELALINTASVSGKVFYHGLRRMGDGVNNVSPNGFTTAITTAVTMIVTNMILEMAEEGQEVQLAEDITDFMKGAIIHGLNAVGRGQSESSDLHPGGSSRPN